MLDLNSLSPSSLTAKYFSHHFPNQLNEILDYPIGESFSEKLYLWYHKLSEIPKCLICGGPVKFKNSKIGYHKYCSAKCTANDPQTKVEIKKTKLKKYGDENYNNREKATHTCIETYGVENPFQSEKIKEKIKKGYNEKYGVDYPSQSQEIQNTRKVNSLKKYGVDHHMKTEEVRNKISKSLHNHHIDNDPDLIGYDEDGNRIMKCPHPECDKCESKLYVIHRGHFYTRKHLDIETCTNILPIKPGRNKDTVIEKFVKNILDHHHISYIANPRNVLDNRHELDIYIPDRNIAIECNGMFWHSKRNKSRTFHYDKFKQCLDKDIQLLTIWEDQIKYQPDIVRSIILSKLGIYKKTIYIQDCEIREMNYKETSKFLEENHIRGKVNFSIGLGLYYQDELVSIMTFRKKSKSKAGEWELNRFCNQLNTFVNDSATILLKYFIKNYKSQFGINTIITFAHNDLSDGRLYEQLGFAEDSYTLFAWYVHKLELTRYHQALFTKSKLKKLGYNHTKSVDEIMSELPYYKIYDCGHTKYVLNI